MQKNPIHTKGNARTPAGMTLPLPKHPVRQYFFLP